MLVQLRRRNLGRYPSISYCTMHMLVNVLDRAVLSESGHNFFEYMLGAFHSIPRTVLVL